MSKYLYGKVAQLATILDMTPLAFSSHASTAAIYLNGKTEI